jgi:hypothetical protein
MARCAFRAAFGGALQFGRFEGLRSGLLTVVVWLLPTDLSIRIGMRRAATLDTPSSSRIEK